MQPYRLLQWTTTSSALEEAMLKGRDREDRDRIARSTASRALAAALLKDSAVTEQRIEPDPEDPWHGERVMTRWTVGIMDPLDSAAFAKQLAEARAEGMRAAAEIVHAKAERYERVDGCGYVIKSSLYEAAKAVERAAGIELSRWSAPEGVAITPDDTREASKPKARATEPSPSRDLP